MADPGPLEKGPAYRDRLPAPILPEGEREIAVIAPDRGRYWRDHAALAALGAVAVMVVLLVLGRSQFLWAGIFGAFAAIALRGLWFYGDIMRQRWLLTDRAVIAPGQDRFDLADIKDLRKLMGDVQIVTKGGRKTLLKHIADPDGVIAQIEGAKAI